MLNVPNYYNFSLDSIISNPVFDRFHPAIVENYMVEHQMAELVPHFGDGRVDPGVRASVLLFGGSEGELHHYNFSYEENVAIAALIALGVCRRMAAALVHHAFVTVQLEKAPPASLQSDERNYWVSISEGEIYRISCAPAVPENLGFIGDYSVVAFDGGRAKSLDDPSTITWLIKRMQFFRPAPASGDVTC